MKRALIVTVLALVACSDQDLYVSNGNDPLVPDRVAIVGDICTEDTNGSAFPVKVLFVVDTSDRMRQADPEQRLVDAPGGIDFLTQAYRNQVNVSFGFIGFNSTARAYPVQQFLRTQDQDLIAQALTSLRSAPSSPQRDYTSAITEAQAFIANDAANAAPGQVLRTRYVVYFITAGPPLPAANTDDLSDQVERMRTLVYGYGALEFQFNFGLFYFGPLTNDDSDGGYACNTQVVDPCVCTPAPTDSYCAAECTIGGNGAAFTAQFNAASTLLDTLRIVGNGILHTWNCPGNVDIQLPIATGAVNLVRKDIIAFNRNVRVGPNGPMVDSDGDGLTDDEEVNRVGTNPYDSDSDNDGLSDGIEARSSKNPLDPLDRPTSCPDPVLVGALPDGDLDLLNDCEEGIIQTSPSKPDTDGDGLTDFVEFMAGTLPTNPEDRLLDFDSDGVLNGDEVLQHTDPRINESSVRGTEGYRTGIDALGLRTIASMEDSPELRAVVYVRGSENLIGGQAFLRWDVDARTLAWVDAHSNFPPFWTPIAVPIVNDGIYRLTAQAPNGEVGWIDVLVTVDDLPSNSITVFPLITIADRNCYAVRISNIKLMQTRSDVPERVGVNDIFVFFTQAPSDRLSQPGIAQVTQVPVVFRCRDEDNLGSCARNPNGASITITSEQFVTAE